MKNGLLNDDFEHDLLLGTVIIPLVTVAILAWWLLGKRVRTRRLSAARATVLYACSCAAAVMGSSIMLSWLNDRLVFDPDAVFASAPEDILWFLLSSALGVSSVVFWFVASFRLARSEPQRSISEGKVASHS